MLSSTLLPLLALVSVVVAEPIHVPLVRRTSNRQITRRGFIDTKSANLIADSVRLRYGYSWPTNPKSKRAGQTVGLPIINSNVDSSYLGTVSVGTPPQTFNVVLDTGSSDFWLASTDCTSCQGGGTLFNPKLSSTLAQPQSSTGTSTIQIQYGSGAVQGTLAQDTTSMGGFTVNPQTFLVVDQVSQHLLDQDTSGIMGLAFQALASTRAVPFWLALTNAGQFGSNEFSFFLTRFIDDANAQNIEPGGVFTLGGVNTTLFTGDIEFQPLVGASTVQQGTFWLLDVTAVNVNGKSVPVGLSSLAAIDTGTTLIGGPTDAVQAIYAAVPGSGAIDNMAGFFGFPCASTPNVSFAFGGKTWDISLDDINLGKIDDEGDCAGAIFDLGLGSNIDAGGGNPSWVVGDTFLKNVYSVFRSSPPSVGFAALSSEAGGTGPSSPRPSSVTPSHPATSPSVTRSSTKPPSPSSVSSFLPSAITNTPSVAPGAPAGPSSVFPSASIPTQGLPLPSGSGAGSPSPSSPPTTSPPPPKSNSAAVALASSPLGFSLYAALCLAATLFVAA